MSTVLIETIEGITEVKLFGSQESEVIQIDWDCREGGWDGHMDIINAMMPAIQDTQILRDILSYIYSKLIYQIELNNPPPVGDTKGG